MVVVWISEVYIRKREMKREKGKETKENKEERKDFNCY